MKSGAGEKELVLEFVRGRRHWRDLERVGVIVSFMDDGCDCEGAGSVVVAPSMRDVAEGLLHYLEGRESDLRRWASVVLAASAVIDLGGLEQHPDGERMISALWDASGGEQIGEEVIELARRSAG